MIIEYTTNPADFTKEFEHFIAYRWWKRTDTRIIDILWYDIITDNPKATFDEIVAAIKEAYKHKTVKSSVRFEEWPGSNKFEIIRKGVFPAILIWKK